MSAIHIKFILLLGKPLPQHQEHQHFKTDFFIFNANPLSTEQHKLYLELTESYTHTHYIWTFKLSHQKSFLKLSSPPHPLPHNVWHTGIQKKTTRLQISKARDQVLYHSQDKLRYSNINSLELQVCQVLRWY